MITNDAKSSQRRLFFICHSLGGIILKKVWYSHGSEGFVNDVRPSASLGSRSTSIWMSSMPSLVFCFLGHRTSLFIWTHSQT